jgi:hypothetical protein
MQLLFEKINGTNMQLDYVALKDSLLLELSHHCQMAEVLILNKFPLAISSQVSLDLVLFLRVKPIPDNKPRIETLDDHVFISNLIIAVSIIDDYQSSEVSIDGKDITIDESFLDISDDAVKLKWGLTNYLGEACAMERDKITVHPVIWLKNTKSRFTSNSLIVAPLLNFALIKQCIALNSYLRYPGYLDWNYGDLFDFNIRSIFEQASKDSQMGFYTKQKIERFHKSFDKAPQTAYDAIGNMLVKVNGKAGTGKSSDLLKMMLNKSLEGVRGTFLTYNHLLVFDISRQLISFKNSLGEDTKNGSTTAYTIHQFMYRIAKKLGVLLLMSLQRVEEIRQMQDTRYLIIKNHLQDMVMREPGINLYRLKGLIQNDGALDEGLKKEIVGFIKFHETKRMLPNTSALNNWIESFKAFKIEKLRESINQEIFLTDYHNVLKNIFKSIKHTDLFFTEFDIESKFSVLKIPLDLKEERILESNGSGKIDRNKLKQRYEKSISSLGASRVVYIDEAQDCDSLEKDILYAIFGSSNVVIASGGKEQLIRFSELCDWDVSKGIRVLSHSYNKRQKSFRMKPAIVALANYVAAAFGIALAIEPMETDDHGKILIHRNYAEQDSGKLEIINRLLTSSERQGCTAYESLLLLKNSKQKNPGKSQQVQEQANTVSVSVDKHDVIKIEKQTRRTVWTFLDDLNEQLGEARIWNATGNVDKRTQSVPGSLSVRALYYESSRGLEAWAAMCFNIDGFFAAKREDDAADNYMLSDIFLQLDPEKRRDMYAATWVLMAITRAIDTCYLEINSPVSAMSGILEQFARKYPDFVEFI